MEAIIKDSTMYYEVHGEGKPIILLHGWSLDHFSIMSGMEPIFKKRQGWKRLYLDLPGCGKTPGASWITNQDAILEAVLQVIDQVIPGERFCLAGESAGAYLARGIVYRRPSWVNGLLLTVPLIVADDRQRTLPPHAVLVEDPQLKAELSKEDEEALAYAVVHDRRVLASARHFMAITGKESDQEYLAKIRNDPANYGFSFDVDALPEPVQCPTLILMGRQDGAVGYRDAWKIIENFPRATFAVLDRAGHMLEIEQKKLFPTLVSEWLDRVEEYIHQTRSNA